MMNNMNSLRPRRSKEESKRNVMAIMMDEDPNAPMGNSDTLLVDVLTPYADHPFRLYEGERLDDMVRSVRDFGVLLPIIVRPHPTLKERYEILSGHNRVNAAKIVGLTKLPVIIKTGLADAEAKLIVTETNLIQRSITDLSHSERAVALNMHLEALKNANGGQGKRTDLLDEIKMLTNPNSSSEKQTSALLGEKLYSVEKVGAQYGLSKNSVARYVRISKLIKSLQNRIDNDEIGIYPAVSLSYLPEDEQADLDKLLSETSFKVDMKKAESLREQSESQALSAEKMLQILSGELNKKSKPKAPSLLKFKAKIFHEFFDGDTPQSEMESVMIQALREYFQNHKKEQPK